jgi:two-component system sensor histidine kinase HydH
MITTEVERIDGTIARLLSFVKPYEPRYTPTVLATLAADCLELVRARAEQRGVVLVEDPEVDDGAREVCDADADQIKQVIINLLINAVEATPAGGVVDLAVSGREVVEVRDPERGTSQLVPGLSVVVSDDGPGVAPDVRARIFHPFVSTKSSGTGLGLAVSHKIVVAHGGDVEVARVADRTVFRVLLPRHHAAGPRSRQQEAQ